MEIVGWYIDYVDAAKTSCILNASLRDRAYADEYAAHGGGIVEPVVKLSEALEQIKIARGEYEGMALVTSKETSSSGSNEETKA